MLAPPALLVERLLRSLSTEPGGIGRFLGERPMLPGDAITELGVLRDLGDRPSPGFGDLPSLRGGDTNAVVVGLIPLHGDAMSRALVVGVHRALVVGVGVLRFASDDVLACGDAVRDGVFAGEDVVLDGEAFFAGDMALDGALAGGEAALDEDFAGGDVALEDVLPERALAWLGVAVESSPERALPWPCDWGAVADNFESGLAGGGTQGTVPLTGITPPNCFIMARRFLCFSSWNSRRFASISKSSSSAVLKISLTRGVGGGASVMAPRMRRGATESGRRECWT